MADWLGPRSAEQRPAMPAGRVLLAPLRGRGTSVKGTLLPGIPGGTGAAEPEAGLDCPGAGSNAPAPLQPCSLAQRAQGRIQGGGAFAQEGRPPGAGHAHTRPAAWRAGRRPRLAAGAPASLEALLLQLFALAAPVLQTLPRRPCRTSPSPCPYPPERPLRCGTGGRCGTALSHCPARRPWQADPSPCRSPGARPAPDGAFRQDCSALRHGPALTLWQAIPRPWPDSAERLAPEKRQSEIALRTGIAGKGFLLQGGELGRLPLRLQPAVLRRAEKARDMQAGRAQRHAGGKRSGPGPGLPPASGPDSARGRAGARQVGYVRAAFARQFRSQSLLQPLEECATP